VSRPPKYTPQRAERVLQAIHSGCTRAAAASHAGIDETTLYRWVGRYASFASDLRAREDEVEIRAVATVQQAWRDDWRAAAWWLERRRPEAYGRRFFEGLADGAGNPAAMQVTVLFDRADPNSDKLALP
jgi:hypothetical protein